jgi:hypothetical protein
MSQQYSRWQDLQQQPGVTRTSQLDELRLRVHQFVIDAVGPMLQDDAIDEVELRRIVLEQATSTPPSRRLNARNSSRTSPTTRSVTARSTDSCTTRASPKSW